MPLHFCCSLLGSMGRCRQFRGFCAQAKSGSRCYPARRDAGIQIWGKDPGLEPFLSSKGGMRTSCCQRDGPGHGHCSTRPPRWTPPRNRGGWAAVVWWRPVCSGHHSGVSVPLRWVSHGGGEGQRRGGTRSSSTTQEDQSRTRRSSSTGSVGRAGG